MEHILEHYLYSYSANLRGFVFGFFHAAIMILGYYTGWSINRILKNFIKWLHSRNFWCSIISCGS